MKQRIGATVLFGMASGTAAVMTSGTEVWRKKDMKRLYKQRVSKNG